MALRQAQGLDVVVSPLESIQDEFNGGRKSSYAIKRYVRHAFDNWNAKFVLLLGDGSEDPLNLMNESSTDWVPVQKINGPVFISFGYEIVPCDPWYVCLNNCDPNTGTPVIPDLFIGRLPVQSLQQARDVIAKLVAYESFSADQTWRSSLLLSSDDEYSAESFFGGGVGSSCPNEYCHKGGERVFRLLNETVASLITETAGLRQMNIDAFNLGTYLRNEPYLFDAACGDTCRPDRLETQSRTHATVNPILLGHLGAGRMWWNFQGHANESVLTHEDLYLDRGFTDDKEMLANDGKPFLFSAFSCHANAFAHVADNQISRGPSIGEDLVNLPNRGAIACFASTAYEILPGSGTSHINVAWADAMFNRPPRDEYLGDRGSRVVLGETIALGFAQAGAKVIAGSTNPDKVSVRLSAAGTIRRGWRA